MDGYGTNAIHEQYSSIPATTGIQLPAKFADVAVQYHSGKTGSEKAIQPETDSLLPVPATGKGIQHTRTSGSFLCRQAVYHITIPE